MALLDIQQLKKAPVLILEGSGKVTWASENIGAERERLFQTTDEELGLLGQ